MRAEDPDLIRIQRPKPIRISKSSGGRDRIWRFAQAMFLPGMAGLVVAGILGVLSSLIVPSNGFALVISLLMAMATASMVTWGCRAFLGWERHRLSLTLSAILTVGSLVLAEYLRSQRYLLYAYSTGTWFKILALCAATSGMLFSTIMVPKSLRHLLDAASTRLMRVQKGMATSTETNDATAVIRIGSRKGPESPSSDRVAVPRPPKRKKTGTSVVRRFGINVKGTDSFVCPVCSQKIQNGQQTVRCPKDGAVHHTECWEINNGCGVLGEH